MTLAEWIVAGTLVLAGGLFVDNCVHAVCGWFKEDE